MGVAAGPGTAGAAAAGVGAGVAGVEGAASAEAVWQAFLRGPETLGPSPGVREAWHRGRPVFTAWALRVVAPEALARVAEAQALLSAVTLPSAEAAAVMRPIPAHDAHVTVFVLGFPSAAPEANDDVPIGVSEEQAAAVAGLSRVRLRLGGLNSFLSAAFLEIDDAHGELAALRARLAAGHRELRFAPYLPHLTVGTYTRAVPTGRLAGAISALRRAPPILLEFDAVELLHIDALDGEAPLGSGLRAGLRAPAAAASPRETP